MQERKIALKTKSGKTREVAEALGDVHGAGLDRFDIAIVAELQRDARLSNAELASRIGLSAAPTWRRVKWLEQQGGTVWQRPVAGIFHNFMLFARAIEAAREEQEGIVRLLRETAAAA